jgi:hypothetical protein
MYTNNELEVFITCSLLISEGYTTSFELEKELYKRFWWITRISAERLVKQFYQNRRKIEEELNQLECNKKNATQGQGKCGYSYYPSP